MKIPRRTPLQELGLFSNQLTLARIALTPLFVVWFVSEGWLWNWLSLAVFVIAAITDWWDGHHARTRRVVSRWGAFLDPLADKILTITSMITLIYVGLVHWSFVAIIFLRDFLLTWLRIRAQRRGMPFTTRKLAKVKTALQLTAIITVITLWCARATVIHFNVAPDTLAPDATFTVLLWISNVMIGATALLAVISAGQYLFTTDPALREPPEA